MGRNVPDWVLYIIAGVGILLIITGAVVLGAVWWRWRVRRYVIRLVGWCEGTQSAYRGLEEVATRLAGATDAELIEFASDSTHLDRKALVEIATQQAIADEELETVALPKRLWAIGANLAAAARAVSREASRVGEDAGPDAVLEGMGRIDLGSAALAVTGAAQALHGVCEELGVEDRAVYGGGLYI